MSSETIDAEVQGTGTALAVQTASTQGAGWALARMTDEEFEQTMKMARKGRDRVQQVVRSMMTPDVHYGQIPGTQKMTLYKPGMEVLCQMFHLVLDVQDSVTYGDGQATPHITVRSRCTVHLNDLDGPVVAVGEGAANSHEKKWRWRNTERTCPECGKAAVIKGKQEYGGGWLCWKKKDGCGHTWKEGDQAIEGQAIGQSENPDPYDLLNTIVKIANKRAKMDATISATASSDLLTQDMEEAAHQEPRQEAPKQQPKPAAKQPPAKANGRKAEPVKTVSDAQFATLADEIDQREMDVATIYAHYQIVDLRKLPEIHYNDCLRGIRARPLKVMNQEAPL